MYHRKTIESFRFQLKSKNVCSKFTMKFIMKIINFSITHCVKSVQIRSYFWSVFSCIRTEYGFYGVNIRIQPEYRKIRTRKNSTDFRRCSTRNNSVFRHFSRSDFLPFNLFLTFISFLFHLKTSKSNLRSFFTNLLTKNY